MTGPAPQRWESFHRLPTNHLGETLQTPQQLILNPPSHPTPHHTHHTTHRHTQTHAIVWSHKYFQLPKQPSLPGLSTCHSVCTLFPFSPHLDNFHSLCRSHLGPGTGILLQPKGQIWPTACFCRASLIAQLVKNLPATQETPVWFLDQEDPMEKE